MGVSSCRFWSRFIALEGNYRQKLTNLLEIDFLNTPTKGLACPGHSGVRGPRPQDAGAFPPPAPPPPPQDRICIYLYISIHIHIYIYKYINIYIYVYIYIYIYMCVCMYMYIQIYMYVYMYIYIYTGHPGVRGPRPQDAGALPPATTRFIKLPGLVKLTNTEPFAAWFVVTGDATADGISVVRSVLGAISSRSNGVECSVYRVWV